ncbi:MAG: hypothetical protein Q7V10_02265 [Methanobacteriaceae archaeon]|jgi:hypothetical protein|nr:hypothetical protein [Methanobacteriaceae archaeon]MDO9626033.1 hypothetical protein [Methanobacteriaceae archaeon]
MKKMIDENKLDLSRKEFQPWNDALETVNKCINQENNEECLLAGLQNLLDETKAVKKIISNK